MAGPFLAALRVTSLAAACALAACGGDKGAPPPPPRPPAALEIEGTLYVEAGAGDFKILERVRQSTASVFPGLRRQRVMVSRREVRSADAASFKQEPVTVVDMSTGARTPAIRVRYRYLLRPDVTPDFEDRLELKGAVLHRSQGIDGGRVLRECTPDTPREREFASSLAFVFDPSLESCKAAMAAEQEAIDAARARLPAGHDGAIPVEELERLYIPVTAVLEARAPRPGEVAPRYVPFDDRLADAAVEQEIDPRIAPALVIVDPDLPRTPPGEERPATGAPGGQAGPGNPQASNPNLPQVIAPPAAAPTPKQDAPQDRFDFSFEQLFDVKYIVVWMSLLMLYPILRREQKNKP